MSAALSANGALQLPKFSLGGVVLQSQPTQLLVGDPRALLARLRGGARRLTPDPLLERALRLRGEVTQRRHLVLQFTLARLSRS